MSRDRRVSSPRRRSPRISIVWLIPVFIFSSAVGAYLAITLMTANLANWGQWLRDFAQSSGAAGFAALIAATIAFGGILKQVSVSRASLEHQREVTRADAWWAMFEWASNRAIPPRQEDQPLPTSVTIRTLERLADEATSSVQEAACAGVIDALTESMDATTIESRADADIELPERNDPVFAALASYVESSRGTSAASHVAETLIYENDVLTALASLEDSGVKTFRSPRFDTGADAIAEIDGRRVVIEIKAVRSSERLRGMVLQTIRRLRDRGRDTDTYVLITPFPSPLPPEQEAELRAVVAQWRKPEDTASLLAALRRASMLR